MRIIRGKHEVKVFAIPQTDKMSPRSSAGDKLSPVRGPLPERRHKGDIEISLPASAGYRRMVNIACVWREECIVTR